MATSETVTAAAPSATIARGPDGVPLAGWACVLFMVSLASGLVMSRSAWSLSCAHTRDGRADRRDFFIQIGAGAQIEYVRPAAAATDDVGDRCYHRRPARIPAT